nr:MAG TPA: hypothetical protein [Caudoviricetes sp.]
MNMMAYSIFLIMILDGILKSALKKLVKMIC